MTSLPEFDYTAKLLDGGQVAGTLTATTEQDALSILAGRQLYPQKVVQSEAYAPLHIRAASTVRLVAADEEFTDSP